MDRYGVLPVRKLFTVFRRRDYGIYIYIYTHTHNYKYIYIYKYICVVYTYVTISLALYIYIYMYKKDHQGVFDYGFQVFHIAVLLSQPQGPMACRVKIEDSSLTLLHQLYDTFV